MGQQRIDLNSARRIYELLDRARRQTRSIAAKEVWATVFGVDLTDPKLLLERYVALLREVDNAIAAFDDQDDPMCQPCLDALGTVRRALGAINWEAPWESVGAQINEGMMVGLNFCAIALGKRDSEQRISNDDLESLRTELDDLVASIVRASIDLTLKREILAALEPIRRAITEYEIGGADGLQRAMDTLLGTLVRYKDAEKPAERSVVKDAFRLVAALDKLVTFARNVKGLLGPAAHLLLGDGSSSNAGPPVE